MIKVDHADMAQLKQQKIEIMQFVDWQARDGVM